MKKLLHVCGAILTITGSIIVLSLWAAAIDGCKKDNGTLSVYGWLVFLAPILVFAAWGIARFVATVRRRRAGNAPPPSLPYYRRAGWWFVTVLRIIGGVALTALCIAIGYAVSSWLRGAGKIDLSFLTKREMLIVGCLVVIVVLVIVNAINRKREEYRRCYLECDCGFKGKGQLCNNYNPCLTLLLLGFDRLFTAMWYKSKTDRDYVKCPRCGRTYYPRF